MPFPETAKSVAGNVSSHVSRPAVEFTEATPIEAANTAADSSGTKINSREISDPSPPSRKYDKDISRL